MSSAKWPGAWRGADPAVQRLDARRRLLAANLAAMAGFVDATGFLAGSGYFVSFMSGNTTRLAVNIARDPARAAMPALLIAGFVAGVICGAWLAMATGQRRKPAVLALVAGLLVIAAIRGNGWLALGGMVMAMGALNNAFQRDGEVAVGLTYMTGALVRGGQGIAAWIAGRRGRQAWSGHLLLWASLCTGAVAGAFAWTWLGAEGEWLAAAWCGTLALAATRLPPEVAPRDFA